MTTQRPFVLTGHVDAELATAMQRLQTAREQADYDAADVAPTDARSAIDVVNRFIAGTTTALQNQT